METRKQKVQWLIDNTKTSNDDELHRWSMYLNMRLIFTSFTHKEIDEYILYCNSNNGACPLNQPILVDPK